MEVIGVKLLSIHHQLRIIVSMVAIKLKRIV